MTKALVIGAGPAGLMAADVMARAGLDVTIADAMPSVGRKFLMAGKSGLNITKDEPLERFLSAFDPLPDVLRTALTDFGPQAVKEWAIGLGQEIFTGSTGRVFPKAMKASPLLRVWMLHLDELGVRLLTRHRWEGWDGDLAQFATPTGRVTLPADVTVLALGGASWARLGSDGSWAKHFDHVVPFAPANVGIDVGWSPHMAKFFGQPMKSTRLKAGARESRGEWVISEKGIEGGGIYTLSPELRRGAPLTVDLLPDWDLDKVKTALSRPRGKASMSNHLRKVLRLGPAHLALLREALHPLPENLAPFLKALPLEFNGLRPLDEAISTAGGMAWDQLDQSLMRLDRESVFCAGEMLDWEAPTGGYLINGCLATGRYAGLNAVNHARLGG